MFLRVSVLVSCSLLVTSQHLAPAIPAQTYPIYQQNGFANPAPNQPIQNTPYHQVYTTQNQSPLPNSYPSIIQQVLLNKFLSNPEAQTNLDPNVRSYGLNYDGYQNNQIAPNLVNKYSAPSQYLNTNDVNREEINEKKTKESKRNRKRSSNKKRKHKNKDNTNPTQNNVKDTKDIQNINTAAEPQRRRKSRKHKTRQPEHENDPKLDDESNTRKTRKRKHKEDKTTENKPKEEEYIVENTKPKKRRRKKPKQDSNNSEKVLAEENVTLKEMKGFNLVQSSGKEENRVIRNSQVEATETKPITKAPEDAASNFLSKLPQLDKPIMSNFLTTYENFYQSLVNNMTAIEKIPQNIETRKPKRTRNNNNNRRRNNQVNKNSTQEITKTNQKVIKVKIDTVTTEKTVPITEKIQTNEDSNNNTESLKSNDEIKEDKENMTILPDDDLTLENVPDLEENVNYPYNGYINDYYPQFTDNIYNANNKENYVKILGDDKYYYATDEEIKRLNNGNSLPERKIKDYEINKQYDDIEEELLKIDDNDNKIDFKTPPVLEKPDFETRPITRSDFRPEVYYKKEDTVPRFVGDKSIESKPQQKTVKPKNLETDYARSKVVKYGSTHSSEPEERTNSDWSDTFKDGGTTYVFAKSLDYPEEYW